VAAGFDAADFMSRRLPPAGIAAVPPFVRVGVPRPADRQFFGDGLAQIAYEADLARLAGLGGRIVEVDFTPFFEVARLLYEGPWVAERYHAVRAIIGKNPDALYPVTRAIISGASKFSAVDAFDALYRFGELRRAVAPVLDSIDVLAVPSIPTIYTVEQVLADPVRLNSNLGTYTNFVNLLDLAAFSIPAGKRQDGLPSSLTLIGKAGSDALLAGIASLVETGEAARPTVPSQAVELAVVGAHLSGMPLNHELTSRNAGFIEAAATTADYRLYALAGTVPPKPGLLRVPDGTGEEIAVEVWSMSHEAFGSFVAGIPAPLGIGTLRLNSGRTVQGFLVEAEAVRGARDISAYKSWRAFISASA
jgi:allophanate hydrolase